MFNKIPEGWKILPLGQIATLQRGFDLPIQDRNIGYIPVYGSNGIDGWHSKYAVKGPGVVTGRSGSIGFIFFIKENFWPLNTTLYVKDFHGNSPQFIARLLESVDLKRFSASTGVPSLNRNFVHPLPVLLPPNSEQTVIASILDKMDIAIEKTEVSIKKLNKIKAGLLHDLLTRGIDENGELRDPVRHPEQFKDSPLGKVPNNPGISTVSLDMLVDLVMQKISGNKNPEFPYIGLENLPTNGRKLLGTSPASISVSINNQWFGQFRFSSWSRWLMELSENSDLRTATASQAKSTGYFMKLRGWPEFDLIRSAGANRLIVGSKTVRTIE